MDRHPSIVWFRQDLRLEDNPALTAAVVRGDPVIPVFVWAPEEEGHWAPGAASRWWLGRSLAGLDSALRHSGSRLVIRSGSSLETLRTLIAETRAGAVFWNRRYEPAAAGADRAIEAALRSEGVDIAHFNASLLFDPGDILTAAGRPYKVFTAFWNHLLRRRDPSRWLPVPEQIPTPPSWPSSLNTTQLDLEPQRDRAARLSRFWSPGEESAAQQLDRFLEGSSGRYLQRRDRTDKVGTSRLSPHLHFGEISPSKVWRVVRGQAAPGSVGDRHATGYLRQIAWREFATHLLHHFPDMPEHPLRSEFAHFPWRADPGDLQAWQKGQTGYPMVDAGMRQLAATGWMHNRARLIVASFLVKHLLLPWHEGARWFWDHLVDADLANNTLGWQWVAGCGVDAAPYFRIFNPVSQGRRFDPRGDYVQSWVPELRKLPGEFIHAPWAAPKSWLETAGVRLGEDYPYPVVEHGAGRQRALAALARMRRDAPAKPRASDAPFRSV